MTLKPSLKALVLLALLALAATPASAAGHPAPATPSAWEAAWRWVVALFVPGVAPNAGCTTDSGGKTTCPANALTALDHGCTINPDGTTNCQQRPS